MKLNKYSLIILLLTISSLLFSQDTITIQDVFNSNLNYFVMADSVESNNFEIYNQSPEWQQKRYNRVVNFADSRVDENGSLLKYKNSWKNMYNNIKNKSVTSNSGLTWVKEGPTKNNMNPSITPESNIGKSDCIYVDPNNENYALLGTEYAGLWKTVNLQDASPHWECITPDFMNIGVTSIQVNPTNTNIIYISTNSSPEAGITNFSSWYGHSQGIFKSIDGGVNWDNIFEIEDNEFLQIRDLKMNPTNPSEIIALYREQSYNILLKTIDGGNTWDDYLIDQNDFLLKLAYNADNPSEIIASGNSNIAFSSNGGVSWSTIFNYVDNYGHPALLPDASYNIAYNKINNKFYSYKTSGNSLYNNGYLYVFDKINLIWEKVPTSYNTTSDTYGYNTYNATAGYVNSFNISDNGSFMCGSVGLSTTEWINIENPPTSSTNIFKKNIYGHKDIRDILFYQNNDSIVYIVTDGGVEKLEHIPYYANPYTIYNKSGDLALQQIYNISHSETQNKSKFYGAYHSHTWLQINNSDNWIKQLPGDGSVTEIIKINDACKIATINCELGYYTGINNGLGNYFVTLTPSLYTTSYNTPIEASNSNPNVVYTHIKSSSFDSADSTGSRRLAKTYDRGATWNDIFTYYGRSYDMVFHPYQDNNMIFSTGYNFINSVTHEIDSSLYKLHYTTDNWATHTTLNIHDKFGVDNPTAGIEYNPQDPNKVWIVFARFGGKKVIEVPLNNPTNYTQIDNGLDDIVYTCIKYDNNTGRLYLGSDWGIYYLEPGTTQWIKDDSFGNISVTDIQIDYSENKMWISTFGNGLFSAELPCGSSTVPVEINTNTNWNTNMYMNSDIIVKSGNTLTINQTVFMADSKKIIVEENALLNVYGGRITSKCNGMWRGIEVQGDIATSQYNYPSNKGFVTLSYATIENAYKAVTSYNGGIIQATATDFFNNYRGITFNTWTNPGYYANKNKSYLVNCNFEINKEVLNNGRSYATSYIYVTNNGGKLDFKGNTLKNTNQNWTTSSLGTGMSIYSSNVDVNYRCKVMVNYGEECPTNERDFTEFNNLSLGIYASAYNASAVEINECEFNNNYRSINISGSSNTATITKNTFNAGNHTSDYNPYSLYLNGTTNYTVEENTFNGNGAADAGVYVYNSGDASNEVYKNTFNNYTRQTNSSAVVACNKNSNFIYGDVYYDGFAGLQFHCNDFTNYNYAMAIVDGNMRKDQGNNSTNTTLLAGNTFDHLSSTDDADFYVDGTIIPSLKIPQYNYYQHNTAIAQIQDYSANVTTNTMPEIYNELACPSHLSTSGGGSTGGFVMMATEIEVLDAEIITEEDELKTLVDNGNTDILLSQTETATNNNFTEVSTKVKQSKGFISDAVAKEYINSPIDQDFVKANTLIEISPLPEESKKELDNTNMNETLKYIVSQYQDGKNVREKKELSIANKKHVRQMLIRNAVRKTMADTLPESLDSLIDFLQTRNEINNRYTLLSLQIKRKHFADAKNELINLNNLKTNFSQEKQEEIETFINLQNIIINIAENSQDMFNSIVDDNLLFLNKLAADSNSIFMATAWSLLEQADKGTFTEVVKLPEPEADNKSDKIKPVTYLYSKHNGLEPLINIYPNPADDHITVEYAMLDKGDNVTIGIYDMQGKLIKQVKSESQVNVLTINISELANGMYNVRFVSALQGHYTVKITKK